MNIENQIQLHIATDEELERLSNIFSELSIEGEKTNHPKKAIWQQTASMVSEEILRRWNTRYPANHPTHKETECYFNNCSDSASDEKPELPF